MLVLSRKVGESIIIGNDIEIQIVEIKGGQIKLGIIAPNGIDIHRKEVYEEIKLQNIQAKDINLETLEVLKKVFEKKNT